MGKEAFLARQAADFDKHYAASRPSAHLSTVGFWMGLTILGVYELLTLGIYAVIRSRVRNPDVQDAGV